MIDRLQAGLRSLGWGCRILLGIWLAGSLVGMMVPPALFDLAGVLRLEPAAVRQLQLWRLVTYALVTDDLGNLLFGALLLGWLGTSLERTWPWHRFLTHYLLCAALAGIALALLARADGTGWLTNVGALMGLLVAWHEQERGQRFQLWGGPLVSAGMLAALASAFLLLPVATAAGWRTATGLAMGALTSWLALRLHDLRAGRRAARQAERPRMRRLEL